MKRIANLLIVCAMTAACVLPGHAADISVTIHFDVETQSKSYIQGEPVIIGLIASNPNAMNAHYQNIAAGTAEKVPEVVVGSPAEPWTDSVEFVVSDQKGGSVPVKIYTKSAREKMITLSGENFAEEQFFIDPAESAKLTDGIYSIKARLKGAESNALSLIVLAKKEMSGRDGIPQLVKFGRYHLARGEYGEALKYADSVLAIDAHSLKGLDIRGDALTGLGRYKEAYKTFTKAIREFFVQNPAANDPRSSCKGPDLFAEKRNKLKSLL